MDKLITHYSNRKKHTPKDPMHQVNEGLARLEKANKLLDNVTFTTPEMVSALVLSSDGKKQYTVILSEDAKHTCECDDHKNRQVVCKHIRACILKKTKIQMEKAGSHLPA